MAHSTMIRFVLIVLVGILSLTSVLARVDYPCKEGANKYTFCDTSLAVGERVDNLVASLELHEKIELLVNNASAVPRLGIPNYNWWNEALHGVAHSPGVSFDGPIFAATSFPQPILTASSFNTTLFNKIGQVVSTEARAFHSEGQAGLTYWTPNINLYRDPRWGRGQETPGEDPHLTSTYAEYFVRGLQEQGDYDGDSNRPAPAHLKVSACCKHFTAYDLDSSAGVQRYGYNAIVTQQDLEDSFNRPFQGCIQNGRSSGLMCSYNELNGIPTCADHKLLTTLARSTWKFDGYIVSDCDAVYNIFKDHKYANSEHTVADVLKAGMDVNCGNTLLNFTEAALEHNSISEKDIDRALIHSFRVQFRLGLFDGNPMDQVYGTIGSADVCTNDHQNLALEAALQSIVLLKNENAVLPFDQNMVQKLSIIGPNANESLYTMLGNYAGTPCKYITPKQGLEKYVDKATYVPACNDTGCEVVDIDAATLAASKADATILVMGLAQEQEREAYDRTNLTLPGKQQDLILAVVAKAKGPVVLAVMSGGPIDITFARDDKRIAGILWVGYPGQAGGEALARIIFGQRNPSGKLPSTWYPQKFTMWPVTIMNMRSNSSGYPGRTYRFYKGETVYKFGDGMSYSTFNYSVQNTSKTIALPKRNQLQPNGQVALKHVSSKNAELCHSLQFSIDVKVTNTHARDGENVVLLYMSPPGAGQGGLPLKQLIGFQRVHVEGYNATVASFLIDPCSQLALMQSDGNNILLPGVYTLSINSGDEVQVHVDVLLF